MLLTAVVLSLASGPPPLAGQDPVPGDRWERVADPGSAGWSAPGLATARARADSLGTAAYLLVHRGRIVDAFDDVARTFRCHSIRKSLLSALYGVHLDRTRPLLDATLAEVGIDDRAGLRPSERRARIRHLLASRSGVYLPAAYENEAFDRFRPERDSHPPGTFWFYSNWDFNAAGTAFQLATRRNLFAAFRDGLARPLEMQDFDLSQMEWRYDRRSWHPAYLFRLSSRDLARFGLLYLRKGRWGDEQVVPTSWVEQTTRWRSDVARPDGEALPGAGYGWMWWVHRPPDVPESFGEGVVSAQGTGTQMVLLLPAHDVVFVHRTDTDLPSEEYRAVSTQEVFGLVELLLAARTEAGP